MGEIDGVARSWGLPVGGTGALSSSIASAARAHGATIRTSAAVESILVEDGRAAGVVLEGTGDELRARRILSGVDPRRTLLGLVGEEHLSDEVVRNLERYRFRGSSAKVNLALDAPPEFIALPGPGEHLRGAIGIAPSLDYLERAYRDALAGRPSTRPFLDMVIPSMTDPSVAPPGKHTLSIFVQYAPYHLAEGMDWDELRDSFGDTVIDTLAEYAPELPDRIVGRQVVTPLDLEREFGLTEGNIFHGELSPEQLFTLRPLPGYARHRMPVRDLWLAGSGAHPGGGLMGAPGRNCALLLLDDLGTPRIADRKGGA
jgi:phytoene dehydrogenase-like protein